jgi:hypothetical protein
MDYPQSISGSYLVAWRILKNMDSMPNELREAT